MAFQSDQHLLFLVMLLNTLISFQPSCSCRDHEISALLQFKDSFFINCDISQSLYAYPKVKSWGGQPHNGDCCSWDGVYCDKKTGHIIGLDLSSSCLYGSFPSNSTIFNVLTHIRHLSLSDNDFNLSRIPSELSQFSKLVSLDLSNSAFSGQIPLALSKLSMLSLLDLSSGEGGPKLSLEDIGLERLVQNLTRLNLLSLDNNDIFSSVPITLTNLTLLKVVSLQFCNLNGQFPVDIFHLPYLEMLYLVGNRDIVGFLPEFRQKSSLRKLDLSETSFHGKLSSSIGQLSNLEELKLYNCDLSGPIPSSLGNLTKLISLDLRSKTAFSGDLPSSLTNLTELQLFGLSNLNNRPERLISLLPNLNKLAALSLNFINLGGDIPSVIANITNLTFLDLAQNQLTGGIPHWLVNLTQLDVLSLSNNQLKGPLLPPGISQLANLNTLILGGNPNLYGNFDGFLKLKNLRDLHLSGVKLTFGGENATNESVSKLLALELSSCNLTEFPHFLSTQNELQALNMGNNSIHGSIPQWFVNATQDNLYSLDLSNNYLTGFEQTLMVLPWTHLEILYLQSNQIQGSLPIPPSSMVVYQVSNNQLTGGIPHQMCQASFMSYFDVSHNSLRGQIPKCISELSSSLFVLNLEGNKFHGSIPPTYHKSCTLKMINLSENQLEGSMPRSLANCLDLEVLDIGRNHVDDTFPSWLGGLPKLHILVLQRNHFHGRIGRPNVGLDFPSLRIIDLSNNFHTGDLPSSYLQNWDAMKVANESQSIKSGSIFPLYVRMGMTITAKPLAYDYSITITNKGNDMQYTRVLTVFRVIDFSSNKFTGRIPNFIGELRGLQALNLSNNNLQGKIPSSLAYMTDLESLDLSNNMLSGQIPQGLAQLTFLEVCNVSHNFLTGPIPQGRQTFDNSSYVGNSGLCGSPLSKKCGNAFEPPLAVTEESNDDTKEDSMLIDWIIRCMGCISGFAVGCAFGKYLTDRNHEWFVETFGRKKKRGQRIRGRRAARPRN